MADIDVVASVQLAQSNIMKKNTEGKHQTHQVEKL